MTEARLAMQALIYVRVCVDKGHYEQAILKGARPTELHLHESGGDGFGAVLQILDAYRAEDGGLRAFAAAQGGVSSLARRDAAERTLSSFGFTWKGGEQWEPPLGSLAAAFTPSEVCIGKGSAISPRSAVSPHDVRSVDVLQRAVQLQEQRSKEYGSPDGERSMPAVVQAFNAITGQDLSESEGWAFLQVLKQVRLFSAPGYHADSAEDNVSYGALLAESKAREK
jgi:hypothetical protein